MAENGGNKLTPETAKSYSDMLVANRAGWLSRQRRARLDRAREAAELERRPNAAVLDLGCADGILWPDLIGKVGSLVGVNYDEWLCRQCHMRYPDHPVVRGDARALPFADNSFDVVFCLEMFHYLAVGDRRQGLMEIKRVLKPGGRMVMSVPIEVGLTGLVKFSARVITRACYPSVWSHFKNLWRRTLYMVVPVHEDRNQNLFHFNVHALRREADQVFDTLKYRGIPFFYPFNTNGLLIADK